MKRGHEIEIKQGVRPPGFDAEAKKTERPGQ